MDFRFLDEQSNEGIKKHINFLDNNTDRITEIDFYLASKGNLEIIKYLIKCGEYISSYYIGSDWTLFEACKSDNLELVKYLVEEYLPEEKKIKRWKIWY